MKTHSRRSFLRSGAMGAAALTAAPLVSAFGAPLIRTDNPRVFFRTYPHPWMPPINWAYATGADEDPFPSNMNLGDEGVIVPSDFPRDRFGVNARWFVPGFGFLWMEADNAGEYYSRREIGRNTTFNFNHELARTRVARNRRVFNRYSGGGTAFSREVHDLIDLSEGLLDEAARAADDAKKAHVSDRALLHAMRVGEKMELEHARARIAGFGRRPCWFGCETRQVIWAKAEDSQKRFEELFNFATITHYVWDTWYEPFEPIEGVYNWGIKDNILNWLKRENITPQGRPILWFHNWVTPDWLKEKNFDELRRYAENHTQEVVSHYGNDVLQWEVVNEYHDWANVHRHTPEQITEMVRLACDKTHEVNPNVRRIINNCCTWSNYAASNYDSLGPAPRDLRSVHRFTKDLAEAGVEYEVIGLQLYFPQRCLSDIARHLERFEEFGKPIYITEVGASAGPTRENVLTGQQQIPQEPYAWHRHWDEELQADWLEAAYTLFYSKPEIEAINWYDFTDFRPFIQHGGLIRENATTKRSFDRLKTILDRWDQLPGEDLAPQWPRT